jgi:hypothetical protein
MDVHFGRGAGEDVSILVAEANLHDLIEGLNAHGWDSVGFDADCAQIRAQACG